MSKRGYKRRLNQVPHSRRNSTQPAANSKIKSASTPSQVQRLSNSSTKYLYLLSFIPTVLAESMDIGFSDHENKKQYVIKILRDLSVENIRNTVVGCGMNISTVIANTTTKITGLCRIPGHAFFSSTLMNSTLNDSDQSYRGTLYAANGTSLGITEELKCVINSIEKFCSDAEKAVWLRVVIIFAGLTLLALVGCLHNIIKNRQSANPDQQPAVTTQQPITALAFETTAPLLERGMRL